jgi:hypothetical protein
VKMPRKDISEQNGPGRGRPVGSRNKFPQILRLLVLNAATTRGYPKEKWIIEPELDSEGNQIWVEVTDKWGETQYVEKPGPDKGKPQLRRKMIRRKVLVWTGVEGAQGYVNFLAEEERNHFSKMLLLAQHQQESVRNDAVEGLKIPTLEELRDEWIRRGLKAVDFDKLKVVTGVEAKQRVKLIEHDPNENRRNGRTKQQNREATSTTDPESEQWWEDEEEDEAED